MIDRVILEAQASPAELAFAKQVFKRHGFEVEAEAGYPLTGGPPTELTWAVYVVLAMPIAAFFNSFGGAAGTDAYAATKSWIKDVFASRKSKGAGLLLLLDEEDSQMRLPSELPDDALDALREIYWTRATGGYLTWDEARREWSAAHADDE